MSDTPPPVADPHQLELPFPDRSLSLYALVEPALRPMARVVVLRLVMAGIALGETRGPRGGRRLPARTPDEYYRAADALVPHPEAAA